MPQILTWWEMFKVNTSLLLHKGVAWVVSAWSLAAILWSLASDADKQALYDAVPFGLGRWVPLILALISYVVANGWPQPKLAEKKDEKVAAVVEKKDSLS